MESQQQDGAASADASVLGKDELQANGLVASSTADINNAVVTEARPMNAEQSDTVRPEAHDDDGDDDARDSARSNSRGPELVVIPAPLSPVSPKPVLSSFRLTWCVVQMKCVHRCRVYVSVFIDFFGLSLVLPLLPFMGREYVLPW